MELGFAVPVCGSWATPANQIEIAQRAEELGYSSLWTFQRLLYPAEPDSPRWAANYRSVHDPIITLAFLAAHTSRVRLGPAVLNMPWFSPLLLAKQLTSLDIVSGGRLVVGLGLGWAAQEYEATWASFEMRGPRSAEFIRCLKAIWTDEVVDFHGRYYDVPAARVDPRPVQQPHPPVLLGGSAPAALRRAGRIADGWVSSSGQDLRTIGESLDVVRGAASEAGRDPESLRFVCRGVVRVRAAGREDRRPLSGSLDEIRADLQTLEDSGVHEVFVDLNFDQEIGTPEADPAESMKRAHAVLDALAP
jgi:probable F420-dependent oxidoreductase